ncbi:hypothetical protein HMPREF9347_03316 [Escherichia coli MS 124-1]|nr:hypothetical protein HMPREF9345_03612 [Escherichia coli MS 107-1]EFK67817.1 hypothetical protein HMPREF9347_03316 [Escherichia coli MS 124-1]EGU95950.1 hypothetical protein HMPREF9349_04178 [Escherichia coli MS 79-10]
MRRKCLIRPTNSINCRNHVGLISVAHQAILCLSSDLIRA